jgi:hypothetical protein
MNHLLAVKGYEKVSRWLVDRIPRDRNESLTCCQAMRESKPVISGPNSAQQESIIYILSRDARKQAGGQWTEFHAKRTIHLLAIKGYEASRWSVDRIWRKTNHSLTCCQGIRRNKPVVNGQNWAPQKSITNQLSRGLRKQASGQWTKLRTTQINHLLPVKGCEKASRWSVENVRATGITCFLSRDATKQADSVDRIGHHRNQSLTNCQGMRESKPLVSGQNSA